MCDPTFVFFSGVIILLWEYLLCAFWPGDISFTGRLIGMFCRLQDADHLVRLRKIVSRRGTQLTLQYILEAVMQVPRIWAHKWCYAIDWGGMGGWGTDDNVPWTWAHIWFHELMGVGGVFLTMWVESVACTWHRVRMRLQRGIVYSDL